MRNRLPATVHLQTRLGKHKARAFQVRNSCCKLRYIQSLISLQRRDAALFADVRHNLLALRLFSLIIKPLSFLNQTSTTPRPNAGLFLAVSPAYQASVRFACEFDRWSSFMAEESNAFLLGRSAAG